MGLLPRQPQGHCEISFCGNLTLPSSDKFFKFHYPNDERPIPNDDNNALLLLLRDPVENIPSYIFSAHHSRIGANQEQYTDQQYIDFFKTVDDVTLNDHISKYTNNINFYNAWPRQKIIIKYEKLILDIENYVFNDLRKSFLPFKRTKKNDDFQQLIKKIFKFKTSTADILKVNTSGTHLHKFREIIPKAWMTKLQQIKMP
jgi:hypothetical protein